MRQNRNVLHGSGDPCHAKALNSGKKEPAVYPYTAGIAFLLTPILR